MRRSRWYQFGYALGAGAAVALPALIAYDLYQVGVFLGWWG